MKSILPGAERRSDVSIVGENGVHEYRDSVRDFCKRGLSLRGGSIVPKERKHPEVNDIELGIHLSEYGFFSAGRKNVKKGRRSTRSRRKVIKNREICLEPSIWTGEKRGQARKGVISGRKPRIFMRVFKS